MSPEWDIQEAVESLRHEMRAGFDRITDKQTDFESRLTAVETKQRVIGGGVWAIVMAVVGGTVSWMYGLIHLGK